MLDEESLLYKILIWIRNLSGILFIIGIIIIGIYYTDVKMELTQNKENTYHVLVEGSLNKTTKAITSQVNLGWYEPDTVSVQMTSALENLKLANRQASEMLTFNKEDLKTLQELEKWLNTYPMNGYDKFAKITEKDKERYEQLAKNLTEANYGMRKNEHYLYDWDEFMKRANKLLALEKQNNSPEKYKK